MFDKSGKVEAFVISVGGFLGIGSKEAALAPNSFDVVPDQNGSADKLKLAVTKGELKNAQAFAGTAPHEHHRLRQQLRGWWPQAVWQHATGKPLIRQ